METKNHLLQIDEILMNKRLSGKQLECTYNRAGQILNIEKDFKINSKMFKNYDMKFEFMHFLFIDRRSLWRFPVSIEDFGHDLYFLIIDCNDSQLSDTAFKNGVVFCVDNQGKMINISFVERLYTTLKDDFFKGVGNNIRTNTVANVTEYVSFDEEIFNRFKKELSDNGDMEVKLIQISENCSFPEDNNEVSTHFSRSENQNRFSLAFQQDPIGGNENFYDIGNMQP